MIYFRFWRRWSKVWWRYIWLWFWLHMFKRIKTNSCSFKCSKNGRITLNKNCSFNWQKVSFIEKLIMLTSSNKFISTSRYFNLQHRILRNGRKLLHVENVGDCCYHLNSQPFFRGDSDPATPGFAGLPRRLPQSIKNIDCANLWHGIVFWNNQS